MIILGIDPGNARCGWGVVEKSGGHFTCISYGCVETSKSLPAAERLLQLDKELSGLIQKFAPAEGAVEDIFLFKNPKTVIRVAEARGVILSRFAREDIPLFSYTPLQVKQAVTSYGRAEKGQVLKMIMRILKLTSPPEPDDAADALAIALCHAAIPEVYKRYK
ncbi:MAG: crossover junction endodeoxyribonuclease RuvC [bacterium]|nr:crossover junction endodeoxyribonuclease RuvC [bacterium]